MSTPLKDKRGENKRKLEDYQPSSTFSKTPVQDRSRQRCEKITVIGTIFELGFSSDHREPLAPLNKLLRPSEAVNRTQTYINVGAQVPTNYQVNSLMADNVNTFQKPEWLCQWQANFAGRARNQAAKSDPISQSKNTRLTVTIRVAFTVTSETGQANVKVTSVRGSAQDGSAYLDFTSIEDRVLLYGETTQNFDLACTTALPNEVQIIQGRNIVWDCDYSVNEGPTKQARLGTTGPHKIYATFRTPRGQLQSQLPNVFTLDGRAQQITEGRLTFSITGIQSQKGNVPNFSNDNEAHHVDALFLYIKSLGIDFFLGTRWDPNLNTTGFNNPPPPLHEYLWLAISDVQVKAECHNLATGFVLGCQMVGVAGNFQLGFIYPWPGRQENFPTYTRRYDNPPVFGKYNQQYRRQVSAAPFPGNYDDTLFFIDQHNQGNNFEGVVRFDSGGREALYAIGEHILNRNQTADENASDYYTEHEWNQTYVAAVDNRFGSLQIAFSRTWLMLKVGTVANPYPGLVIPIFQTPTGILLQNNTPGSLIPHWFMWHY